MKLVCTIAILLLAAASGYGQTTAKPRRSLDSMDLLTVGSPSARPRQPAVTVSSDVYKVLSPLIKYAREAEEQYRLTMIDAASAPPDRNVVLDQVGRRVVAIQRSMIILQKIDGIPQDVCDRLIADFELAADTTRVTALLRLGDESSFPKEINALKERFRISGSLNRFDGSVVSERELLLAAMLRLLSENLSAFKPIE